MQRTLLLSIVGIISSGCSDPTRTACRKLKDCSDAPLAEREQEERECIDDLTTTETRSDELDCSAEFDDYLACATDHLQCGQNDVVGPECNEAETALLECMR